MTPQQPQQHPDDLLLITREELDRCCSQMSAAGYKVSANYVEASVLSRSRPATTPAPCPQHKIWQHCPVAGDMAAKAREDVLDELKKWVDSECWHNSPAYPHKHHAPRKREILGKIQSLRSSSTRETSP